MYYESNTTNHQHTSISSPVIIRNVVKLFDGVRRRWQRIPRIARVRCRMGHVQEQRLRDIVRLDQTHRLVRDHVRRVRLCQVMRHLQVASHVQTHVAPFLGRMIKVVLMPRPEAQMRIESAIRRRVLSPKVTQMPFAHNVRRIAQLLQVLRQQLLGQRQTARLGRIQHGVLHAGVDRQLACHQRRAGWRANGRYVEAIENQTRIGERIDVGRGQLRRTVEANVVPALCGSCYFTFSTLYV